MDDRCSVCGSEEMVTTGPLVRLYPPGIRLLTESRRSRLQARKRLKHHKAKMLHAD
ncbi:hypothetical protein [Sulfobacillus thermotolerans]|uniref:hypothetical protein n=1 Tax=Sulfobacillus thermotolerans TaxID=338644 RepID=UPI00336677BE